MLAKIKGFYQTMDQKLCGVPGILKNAGMTYSQTRASQNAASLAYYFLFSLFPLLLVITAVGSFFLNSADFYQYLLQIIQITVPVSADLISENLNHLIEARGTVGLLSMLTLLWAASGLFANLANSISLAWPEKSRRNIVQVRLIGVGTVVGLSALLVLSLILLGLLSVTPLLDRENGSILTQAIWNTFSGLGSWLSMFCVFIMLYNWIPSTDVPWRATVWGALFTTLGWRAAIWGFTWYVKGGLGQYQLIYGTLGAIVVLLFLIYILANIMLFGAHLSAAIDHWESQKKGRPQENSR
ncbi:MAG: YihY/virulence factor BrkB family protein [Anaerolineaceae bacterium]